MNLERAKQFSRRSNRYYNQFRRRYITFDIEVHCCILRIAITLGKTTPTRLYLDIDSLNNESTLLSFPHEQRAINYTDGEIMSRARARAKLHSFAILQPRAVTLNMHSELCQSSCASLDKFSRIDCIAGPHI